MKRCFIFGALDVDNIPEKPSANDYVIAADRGYRIALSQGIVPDLVVGVASGREIPRLKRIIKEEDPKAFIFITDTHETLGEGFAQLK